MAELDRRLRLAVAGPQGPDRAGGRVEEGALAATMEGVAPEDPGAGADTAVPPGDRAIEEPEVLLAVEDGAPAGNAAEELPPVEDLAKRLRPEVLAALDELFRAKWTGVKRLRPGDLKTGR
jgi:hypothetical protein